MGNNVTLIPKQPARHSLLTNVENVVYMPLASRHSHGIVKIGEGLNITADGLLSVDVNSEWYATIRGDVDQLKVSVQDLKTDVDTALMDVSDINEKLSDIENGTKLISVYQTKQDSGLVTINKTVVGGINELKDQTTTTILSIDLIKNDLTGVKRNYATLKYVDDLYANLSMGGSKSYVFETREQFISWLDGVYEREDSFKPELLNIGDIVLIEEMGVPDYWVKSKSSPMTINDFREYEAKIDIPEVTVDDISINKNSQGELQTIAIKHGRLIVGDTVSKSDFKGWIELKSVEQFKQLVEYGSIVVDGETIVYDENCVYVTPEPYADEFVTLELFEQLQSTVDDLTPKVMRALLTPMSAPSAIELVAVDDGNSQTMIEIGEGLLLTNGTLKADLSYPEVVADGVAKTGAGDRVIETYISSDRKTWYRKWASGWKECGFNLQGNGLSWAKRTLTYPVTFSNINSINIQCSADAGVGSGNNVTINSAAILNKTISSVDIMCDSNWKRDVYICGY